MANLAEQIAQKTAYAELIAAMASCDNRVLPPTGIKESKGAEARGRPAQKEVEGRAPHTCE